MQIEVLRWIGDATGHLEILDQVRLPAETHYLSCTTVEEVWQAIRRLSVRGAPAIGIAAGYGMVVALNRWPNDWVEPSEVRRFVAQNVEYLSSSRPTAVNLFWALERMQRVSDQYIGEASSSVSAKKLAARLLIEAMSIHSEDREMCAAIGRWGRPLIRDCRGIMTHCNAGALATGGCGTALAPIYQAHEEGQTIEVYADETRPLLQGARLTAWELVAAHIPVTVICDNMAASVLRSGRVQAVIVGADRITRRGDAANKIGTYGLAILAHHHKVPFFVAAPSSTFDMQLHHGDEIPIELREPDEIRIANGKRTVADGAEVFNPAFDYTPAELITAIITEKGLVTPVTEDTVRQTLFDKR